MALAADAVSELKEGALECEEGCRQVGKEGSVSGSPGCEAERTGWRKMEVNV